MRLKVTQKQALQSIQAVYFKKTFCEVKGRIFLNETGILAFAKLAIFDSI